MLLDFIKDPFVYSLAFYIVSVFSIPIHIFGSYCILVKTPVIMKSVKWALFNLHFWSAALDIFGSLFVQPFLCTPALAGFSLGLCGWMGMPTPIWAIGYLALFRLVPISIISMFENRFFVLFVNSNGIWRYLRYPFLIVNYALVLVFCVPMYLDIPEDQVRARRLLFKTYPGSCDTVTDRSIVFVMNIGDDFWTNLIRENLLMGLVLIEIIVLVVLLRVKMNKAIKNIQSSISLDTLQKQKKFIRALNLQIAIPILIIFFPAIIGAVIATQNSSQQGVDNLINLITSLHGVSATILMIYLQPAYRDAFLNTFCCKKPSELKFIKVTSLQSQRSGLC